MVFSSDDNKESQPIEGQQDAKDSKFSSKKHSHLTTPLGEKTDQTPGTTAKKGVMASGITTNKDATPKQGLGSIQSLFKTVHRV